MAVVTKDQIMTVLGNFVQNVLPGLVVVQAQINRVPEPADSDFVVLNMIGINRLSTNLDVLDYANDEKDVTTSSTVRVQMDVHGPNSAANSATIVALFRDEYAYDFFYAANPSIAPLHADDAMQTPFENDQTQVEFRWIIDATLECTSEIAVPQLSADELSAGLIPVNTTYPAA